MSLKKANKTTSSKSENVNIVNLFLWGEKKTSVAAMLKSARLSSAS